MPRLANGTVAPDFELAATDGKKHALKQSLGDGPVLTAFFKVSCPTCQFTFPFLERLYQQIRESGGRIWGISQDGKEDSARFATRYGVTFPILIDEKPYPLSRRYGLECVPSLFLIVADQTVQVSGDGFSKADLAEIQRRLAEDLSITPPPLFRAGEKVPEYKPG